MTDPTGLYGSGGFTKMIGKLVETFFKKPAAQRAGIYAVGFALTKALIGTKATYTLGEAYIEETDADPKNVYINRAIARKKDKDYEEIFDRVIDLANLLLMPVANLLSLRPDIVDKNHNREQFYEVKATESAFLGYFQVPLYEVGLYATTNTYFPPGNWQPSRNPYPIIDVYGIPLVFSINARLSQPGLILWDFAGLDDALILMTIVEAEVFYYYAPKLWMQGRKVVSTANNAQLQTSVASAMLVSTIAGFAF
jgi:hypothetical protein